jgi:predicted dithiol-disulfide oxidoreductase (DUF899 family)
MEHSVVSRDEWLEARRTLLMKEKEMTRMRDRINADRLALPWVKVDKDYVFTTPTGRKTLAELFDGRSQLVVYHFMFGPDWEAGCPGCSFLADHLDGAIVHLNNHDVSFVCVSRPARQDRGLSAAWTGISLGVVFGSDFNFDYHVSFTKEELAAGPVTYNFRETPAEQAHDELPGLSSFYRDTDGTVYHTYSNYARGGEEMLGTMMILDCAPLGRNEGSTMDFVKRHDEYETRPKAATCCH